MRLLARLRNEDGSAATELVILVPMVALLLGFTVMAGRMATTKQDVTSASRDAARAASVRQFPAQAQADALAAVNETLTDRGTSCQGLVVQVDTSDLQPGGRVEATVTCTIGLGDVVGLGVPGSKTVSSTSTAVVDTHRGGRP